MKEEQMERQAIEVKAVPFIRPNAVLVVLTGMLALKDPKIVFRPLARICEKVAAMQHLDPKTLREANTYALLGISEDGSVMALSWRNDAWLPARAPIPSVLARSKELGLVRLEDGMPLRPVWVRMDAQKLTIFKMGKEIDLWKAPAIARPNLKPKAPQNVPKAPAPPEVSVAPAAPSKGTISPHLPADEPGPEQGLGIN